jgi:uncharacterized repeat protein (TIGR03803 family)
MLRIHAATLVRASSFAILAVAPMVAFPQAAPELSTIVAFSGSQATANAVLGPDGGLYGTTSATSIVTGGLIYRAAADGSSVRTIYQLTLNDGLSPVAGLLVGSDGLLYGSTTSGAVSQLGSTGTVFRLSPDGSGFLVIHRVASYVTTNVLGSPVNTDGATPESELIEGPDRFLYGVTRNGGPNGTGVVFKLAKDGSGFAVLHAFGPVTSAAGATPTLNADGLNLLGPLVATSEGVLYGTASSGGAKVPRPPFPGETVTIPPPIPLLPGRPTSYSQRPESSYMPAVVMTASACRQVSASTTCSPVTGFTPPSASVAPITARSWAVTSRQRIVPAG